MRGELVGPADLHAAGEVAVAALEPVADTADWTVLAGGLPWTCRRTLDHMCDCLLYYAGQLACRGARQRPQPRNGDERASVRALVDTVTSTTAVLAAVAYGTAPDVRAYHPAGMADRSGFCAMGADEILVHTHDIASGLALDFVPPADLCAAVVARLFPWAPSGEDPWATLLWCNGRRALRGRARLGADCGWHCAPLSEWDGRTVPRVRPPRYSS